jgi:uncharacterized protein YndB with AHSA1/START domain
VASIVMTTEIARSPDEVFAYVTDPSRFNEWQEGVVSAAACDGPQHLGSTCTMTRKIGGADRVSTAKITEFDPPRSWAIRGVDGPIRAIAKVTVEPLAGGARSRVTIVLDFEGHGAGKLIVPLVVVPQARKQAPVSCQRLKERLEGGV